MKIERHVHAPMFPNFLKVEGMKSKLPVSELTNDEAAGLWDDWKQNWLNHVADKRMLKGTEGK